VSYQVKLWITHNEPWVIAHHGYETGEFAPGRMAVSYAAAHNLILAHARVYRMYQDKYKSSQKGINSFFNELISVYLCNLRVVQKLILDVESEKYAPMRRTKHFSHSFCEQS